jgi:hypothetical protein
MDASPCASMRSMLPRKLASVLMRAPVMRRSSEMVSRLGFEQTRDF